MDNWKSLFEDLRDLVGKNLWAVGLGVGCLVLVGAIFMGAQAIAGASAPDKEPGAETAAATTDEAETEQAPKPSATLTDEQAKVVAAYGEDQKALASALASLPWVTPKGSKVTFSEDGAWTGTDNETHPFAISAVAKPTTSTETVRDNVQVTVTTKTTSFSVLTEDGKTTICTLNETTDQNGTSRTLMDTPFADGSALTAHQAADTLSLDVPDALAQSVGGHTDELVAAVRRWTTANAPSASAATWDGTTRNDYKGGKVAFDLALNDGSSTKLTVTYTTKDAAFDVQEGKGSN